MLTIIIITLSILVVFNLFLLKFSCNSVHKESASTIKNKASKHAVLKPDFTTEQDSDAFASTGS